MAASEEQNPATTPSYILLELSVLEGIFTPIKSSSRVKYTCFDISRRYLVLGSSCGDIFVFLRETLTYLSTVPSKEGSIVQVSIAAEENVLGYASSRGHVLVVEHNAEKSSAQAQRLQLSYEHKGALVTSLQWNSSTTKLFVGDDKGKATVVNVSTSRTRNLFQMPSTSLMKLDSRIVQLDFAQDQLLVSTLTRCHLCDTIKEQYSQIGKKLRDGDYGACFYPGIRLQDPCTIFSARPGSRFWEVDLKGNVLRTHQFKQALAVPPVQIVSFRKEIEENSEEIIYNPQTVAFHKLYTIWPSLEAFPFLLTSGHRGLYVFDPKKAKVVLWCNEITGIRNIRSYKNDIYVQYGNGKMAKYSLVTIEKAVCHLYQHGLLVQSAQLILSKLHLLTPSVFQFHMTTALLSDLKQKLLDMGRINLADSLSVALSQLEITADSNSQDSRASSAMSEPMKLESGIYIVSRGREKESDDDCHCKSSLRSTRWRSSSPMLRQTHGSVVRASPSIKITGRAHSYGKRPQSRSPTPVVLKDKVRSHKQSTKGIKMKNDRPQDDDIETAVSTEPDSPELWNGKKPLHTISLEKETSTFGSPTEDALNSLPIGSASDGDINLSCDDCRFASESFNDECMSVVNKDQQAFNDVNNEIPLSDSFPELDRRSCDSEERNASRKQSVTLDPQLEFNTESPAIPGSIRKYRPKSIEDLLPYEYRLKSGGTPSTFSSTNSSRESLIFSESQSSGKTTPQTGTPFGRSERNSPMGDIDEILLSSAYKDSVSFDSYFQFAMYGGGMLLPSSMDFSLFSDSDTTDSSIVELSKIKDSISAKLTSTTKGILQNLRNFDLKLKQRGQNSSTELLDVKSKVKTPTEQTDSSAKPLGTRFDDIIKSEEIESITQCYSAIVNEDFWSFLPAIDILDLLEASKKAKHQLKDPDIIYNKESLHSLLTCWLKCLIATQIKVLEKLNECKLSPDTETIVPETTDFPLINSCGKDVIDNSSRSDAILEELTKKFSSSNGSIINHSSQNLKQLPSSLQDFVFIHDQFRLSQSDHQLLSELATLCFQTGTWGDLAKLHSFMKKECNKIKNEETEGSIKINDRPFTSFSQSKNSFNMYSNYNINKHLDHSLIQQYTVDNSVSSKEINVSSNVLKDSELLLCSIIESQQKESPELLEINQTLEPTTLNISKNGDIHSIKWTDESVLNGKNKEDKFTDGEMLISTLDQRPQDESINMSLVEETIIGEESLWDLDQYSAVFIQNFFHLLDLGKVREIITTENRTMFKTWCSLVKGAILLSEGDDFNQKVSCGQISAAIQCLEVSTWTSIILVGHLFQLVREHPAKVIELCIKRSHQIAPRDVLYLAKVSGHHPELFASYITQFLEPLPVLYHARLMDRLLQCEEVRWEWIQTVLNQEITLELKCKCGAPRPGSHMWLWKDGNLLLHVLSTISAHDDKLMQLCCQMGFWLGYLQIIKKLGDQKHHLMTVIQLADINLISTEHESGYLPDSVEVWKEVLLLINKQQSETDVLFCLTCDEKYSHQTPYICSSDPESKETWRVTLTWENIAKKLLECLGPAVALSLLKELKIPAGSLTPKFYRMCILTQVMDQQQSALSRNMLTYLENYLWSRRPTTVPPEDYQIFLRERQKLQQLGDLAPSLQESKSMHKQQSRFLEEPEGHWGIQTQLLSLCPLCGVALSSQLSSSSNGITVCSCGHAYHSVCLPEGFCVSCLSKESKEK